MVKKLSGGLVEDARQEFERTRLGPEHWLRGALGPLNRQITERQGLMIKRVENLTNLKGSQTSVQGRFKQLDQQRAALKKQGDQLDQLRADLALRTRADAPRRDAQTSAAPG